jgi:hypothetical protein
VREAGACAVCERRRLRCGVTSSHEVGPMPPAQGDAQLRAACS